MSSADQDQGLHPNQAVTTIISLAAFVSISLTVLSFPQLFNRHVSFALLVSATYLSWHFSDGFPDVFAQNQWLRALIMFVAHASYIFFLRENGGDVHAMLKMQRGNVWYRGYKLLFNLRGIGTDWELPYLYQSQSQTALRKKFDDDFPDIQKAKEDGSGKLNDRWIAVRKRLFYILVNYLVLCLYYEFLYLQPTPADFAPFKESLLRRVLPTVMDSHSPTAITTREVWIRSSMVLDFILTEYCWLSCYHDVCAIIFIGVGLDQDDEWPPIMGPLSAATTLRGFWGRFWHRILYRAFSEHAAVVARWLGLKKGSLSYRLVSNVLVFAFSAAMHAAVSARLGNRCAWGRTLWYWMLQPVGFLVEGVVQGCWRKYRSRMNVGGAKEEWIVMAEYAIGYSWVFSWFFWCELNRIIPLVHCGED